MGGLENIGRWIIATGVILVVVGGIVWLLGRYTGLSQLPGTLRIQGSGFTCMVPILGMIVVSVVLTILLNVLARIINR
jgi:Protein of unknown function (DUF2905)